MALDNLELHPDAVDMPTEKLWREVLSNSRDHLLDRSAHNAVDVDVSSGGTVSPTLEERLANGLLRFTGAPGSDPVLDIPEASLYLELVNAATRQIITTSSDGDLLLETGVDDLLLEDGSGTLLLEASATLVPAGETRMVFKDGVNYRAAGSVGAQAGQFLHDGSVPASGAHDFVDRRVTGAELRDVALAVTSPTVSAGVLTLDMENGNAFDVTLDAAVATLNLDNPPASGLMGVITLVKTQDGTGGFSITWPASVKWEQDSGFSPAQTTAADSVDVFMFVTFDAGATWYGFVAGLDFG